MNSKLFRSRNIIVVSQGEVKHYPVSSKLQLFFILLVMGTLSWGSYSTGSYFAAQTILEEKERKIETTTLVNRRIEEQYGLLKRDLVKLKDNDGELNDYQRFVISQHSGKADDLPTEKTAALDDGSLSNLSHSLLQDRIDYLEGLVDQLKNDHETLVSSIRARTKDQITAFKDIIDDTGLSLAKLQKQPDAKAKRKEIETANAQAEANALALAAAGEGGDFTNQGGPYVPESPSGADERTEEESAMFSDIDDMMLLSDITGSIPLAKPLLTKYHLSSKFGRRVDPINKRWAMHKGLDFVGKYGDPVHATADGVVKYAARNSGYGNLVELDHGYGITTRYAHMKKILVAPGDKVKKGDVVGLQGNTGRSTGSHMHYEVRFNRVALNPMKFIEAGDNVF